MTTLKRAFALIGTFLLLQLAGCASTPAHLDVVQKQVSQPTPLMQASAKGEMDKVSDLVNKGAPVNAVCPQGTALTLAVAHGYDHIAVKLLGEGAKPDLAGEKGITALMLAAQNNDQRLVNVLLDSGANVNAQDARGSNAVAYAARQGNLAVIRRLLSAGGNVNIVVGGESLLMQVVDDNNLLMAQVLIGAGADVNYRGVNGRTALTIARAHHNRDIEMLLMQAGAKSS